MTKSKGIILLAKIEYRMKKSIERKILDPLPQFKKRYNKQVKTSPDPKIRDGKRNPHSIYFPHLQYESNYHLIMTILSLRRVISNFKYSHLSTDPVSTEKFFSQNQPNADPKTANV